MEYLRNARILARFVLVWFALVVGVAVASPLVKPQGFALVCSTAGVMKVLPASDDSEAPAGLMHAFDCPLCVTTLLPLPWDQALARFQTPRDVPTAPTPWVHAALRPAAPLPARGPPRGS